MSDIQEMVDDVIYNNNVVVFTKTTSADNEKVKELIEQNGGFYYDIDLDKLHHPVDAMEYLFQLTDGYRLYPMVFVRQKFIGGYNELNEGIQNGTLRGLL